MHKCNFHYVAMLMMMSQILKFVDFAKTQKSRYLEKKTFFRVMDSEKEWFWWFCLYWALIKIKNSMIFVDKEYKVKIKKWYTGNYQSQRRSFYWIITWKLLFSAGEHFPGREGKGCGGGGEQIFNYLGGDPVGKTLKKTSFLYFTYLQFQQLQEQQEIVNRRWQGHASWFVLGQLGYNQQLLSWLKMMPNQWASSMDIRWCPSEFYEKYTLSSWKCVILSFICFFFLQCIIFATCLTLSIFWVSLKEIDLWIPPGLIAWNHHLQWYWKWYCTPEKACNFIFFQLKHLQKIWLLKKLEVKIKSRSKVVPVFVFFTVTLSLTNY